LPKSRRGGDRSQAAPAAPRASTAPPHGRRRRIRPPFPPSSSMAASLAPSPFIGRWWNTPFARAGTSPTTSPMITTTRSQPVRGFGRQGDRLRLAQGIQ
jgi:hypothetical protein